MELSLVAAWLVVYVINLAPAFMPPTWAILAFLHLALGLPVLPLAVGGAFAASLGRYSLAVASRRYGIRLVPARKRRELAALGTWLDARSRWAAPAMLLYSFGPIPSNQLFVAAGLTGMSLGPVVFAFFAGRLVSYPLWVSAARAASARLGDLFMSEWRDGWAVLLNIALLGLLAVFVRIDWSHMIAGVAKDPATRGLRPFPTRLDARVDES
jgi:membrane protein YqaA with SNARE-associated domain